MGYSTFTYDEGFMSEKGPSFLTIDTPDAQQIVEVANVDS